MRPYSIWEVMHSKQTKAVSANFLAGFHFAVCRSHSHRYTRPNAGAKSL
jgi:hypothetical protein